VEDGMTRRRPLGLGTHIFVPNADAAVAFHTEAFAAAELIRHRLPDGRVPAEPTDGTWASE